MKSYVIYYMNEGGVFSRDQVVMNLMNLMNQS